MINIDVKRDDSVTINLKNKYAKKYLSLLEEIIVDEAKQFCLFDDGTSQVTTRRYLFRKAGEGFELAFEGKSSFFLKESVGLKYIHCLLGNQNRPVSVQELAFIRQNNRNARVFYSAEEVSSGHTITNEYENGDVRSIIAKLKMLRDEKHIANDSGDFDKSEKLQYTIEQLEDYIKKARSTKSDDGLEKLRIGVKNAISKTIERIRNYDSDCADYLEAQISTGYTCMYKNPPSDNIRWYFR